MPAAARKFELNGQAYSGFLKVMDISTLESMNGCVQSTDLLRRCASVGGAFSIIQAATRNIARNTDQKKLQADFSEEISKNSLESVGFVAHDLLMDTGLFKRTETEEEEQPPKS